MIELQKTDKFYKSKKFTETINTYVGAGHIYQPSKKIEGSEHLTTGQTFIMKLNQVAVQVHNKTMQADKFFLKHGASADTVIMHEETFKTYIEKYDGFKPTFHAYVDMYTDIEESGFNQVGKYGDEKHPFHVYIHESCKKNIIYILNSQFPGCGLQYIFE